MCKSSVLLFCQWQRNLIPNREVGLTVTLHLKALQKELFDAGLRLNKIPPDVKIKKKSRGGVAVHSTVKLKNMDKEINI